MRDMTARNLYRYARRSCRCEPVQVSQSRRGAAVGDAAGQTSYSRRWLLVHKLASTADGGLGIAIPHGQISDVLAELAGINVLKGRGPVFSLNNTKVDIRCGIIDFETTQGNIQAKTLFVDTTNVLITGRGGIQLGSEAIDLSMQGDPNMCDCFDCGRLSFSRATMKAIGGVNDWIVRRTECRCNVHETA